MDTLRFIAYGQQGQQGQSPAPSGEVRVARGDYLEFHCVLASLTVFFTHILQIENSLIYTYLDYMASLRYSL
jgi:hypothetical protein